jgi:AcrR family transcriptional regulator
VTADRRTLILDAAIRLLEQEGAQGFKQTRIAEEAGLEQGHLTYYFPRKLDLVRGVFEHFATRTREAIMQARGAAGGAVSRHDPLAVVVAMAKDHRRTRVLLGLLLASPPDHELAEQIASFVHAQRKAFAMLVGRPEGDLDAEVALAAIRGIAVDQMLLDGSDRRVEARVQRVLAWLASR